MSLTFCDTTRTRHRGGNGTAFLPRKKRKCCSSGGDGGRRCLAPHPDLDNAKLEGGRKSCFRHDGPPLHRRDCKYSARQFKRDPQPPEAPLFPLPRSRAFTTDAVIKILKSWLLNTGICPRSYKSYSFRCGAAQWAHGNGFSEDEIQLIGHWASDAAKRSWDRCFAHQLDGWQVPELLSQSCRAIDCWQT